MGSRNACRSLVNGSFVQYTDADVRHNAAGLQLHYGSTLSRIIPSIGSSCVRYPPINSNEHDPETRCEQRAGAVKCQQFNRTTPENSEVM